MVNLKLVRIWQQYDEAIMMNDEVVIVGTRASTNSLTHACMHARTHSLTNNQAINQPPSNNTPI